MLRRVLWRREILFAGVLQTDVLDDKKNLSPKQTTEWFSEDKWKRVWTIFKTDYMGNHHPFWDESMNLGYSGFTIGLLFSGLFHARKSYHDFIHENQGTRFMNMKDANTQLYYKVILEFGKQGLKYGVLFGSFFLLFGIISSVVEAYRNKIGVIDCTIAGLGTGSLLRSHFGIKGMISGGTAGAALGTIFGAVRVLLAKISGIDLDDLKFGGYSLEEALKLRKERAKALSNIEDSSNK